jgi:hypothetical protein
MSLAKLYSSRANEGTRPMMKEGERHPTHKIFIILENRTQTTDNEEFSYLLGEKELLRDEG